MQHKNPCNECPWRRKAAPGWLGGRLSAADWIAAAQSDEKIPCHKQRVMTGPKAQHCVGAATFRTNICKSPRDPSVLTLPRNTVDIFSMPQQFLDHHSSSGVAKMLAEVVAARKPK